MDEYISRKEAIDKMRSLQSRFRAKNDWDSGYDTAIAEAFEHIKRVSVADVQPVKHGKWINHRINDEKSLLHGAIKDTTCSECGKSTPYKTNYCMHCGARMDGGNEDEND